MIKAQIVADSIDPRKNRLTTMLITFPRFILAELNTHRMLSKKPASSRAIPFKKMVEAVQNNPFIPIAWQKDHKGMQGTEYITEQKIIDFKKGVWLIARDEVVNRAEELNGNLQRARSTFDIQELPDTGVTKQLCNRLLEPFMWHTVLLTATEFENFFKLRCPSYDGFSKNGEKVSFRSKKDVRKHFEELKLDTDLVDNQSFESWQSINTSQAEIHMQALAEAMWDAMNESTPKKLQAGEWHIPFEDKINIEDLIIKNDYDNIDLWEEALNKDKVKISTAMAARTSYTVVGDEKEFTYEQQIALHDRMANQVPFHASPFEHCAKVMTDWEYQSFVRGNVLPIDDETNFREKQSEGWCRNYRGFIQYREILENK